jgi:hypothetical protein
MKLPPFWQGVVSILDIFGTTSTVPLKKIKRITGKSRTKASKKSEGVIRKQIETTREKVNQL